MSPAGAGLTSRDPFSAAGVAPEGVGGPSFGVIIPTIGRETLSRTLHSIVDQQRAPGDEVLLIADTHESRAARTSAVSTAILKCRLAEPRVGVDITTFELDAGHACYGACQRTFAARFARGDWLLYMDDDDVYVPGSFAVIRRAIALLPSPRPVLFKVVLPDRRVVWPGNTAPPELSPLGYVSTQCVVVPNVPERLGGWPCVHDCDHPFIAETVAKWGGLVEYRPEVIAVLNPGPWRDHVAAG